MVTQGRLWAVRMGRDDVMETDHDLTIEELSIRLLGLVHMSRLYWEIGCPDDEVTIDLHHAAAILAERLLIEV